MKRGGRVRQNEMKAHSDDNDKETRYGLSILGKRKRTQTTDSSENFIGADFMLLLIKMGFNW
jgi:hypothetical protein